MPNDCCCWAGGTWNLDHFPVPASPLPPYFGLVCRFSGDAPLAPCKVFLPSGSWECEQPPLCITFSMSWMEKAFCAGQGKGPGGFSVASPGNSRVRNTPGTAAVYLGILSGMMINPDLAGLIPSLETCLVLGRGGGGGQKGNAWSLCSVLTLPPLLPPFSHSFLGLKKTLLPSLGLHRLNFILIPLQILS